ncbi:Hypothetical protein Y17_3311 [Pectobacterium wasabiae CFBP 3304]|nr:Hypothetical protein Y17_3311 [Pectobacterium wasabiae CFBP 3304]
MKTFQEERKKRHVIRDNSKNIAQCRSFKDRDTGGYHGARYPCGNLITVFPPKYRLSHQDGAIGRALTRVDAKEFRQPERDSRNISDQHQYKEEPTVEGQHRFNDLLYLLFTHRTGDEKH